MSIGELDALFGQLIDIGSGDFRFGVKTLWISISHVVDENNDDVWHIGFAVFTGQKEETEKNRRMNFEHVLQDEKLIRNALL